jgi:microcystin-dependent protein
VNTRGDDRSGLGVGRYRSEPPVGTVIVFAGDLTVVATERRLVSQGWIPCDGRPIAIHGHHDLYRAIGRLYSPSATAKDAFCVPDYRGQFLRGVAQTAAQDPGIGSRTAPAGGSDPKSVGSAQAGMVEKHQHHYQALEGVQVGNTGSGGGTPPLTPQATSDLLDAGGTQTLSGEETRPKNVYVNYLIKAANVTRGIGVIW